MGKNTPYEGKSVKGRVVATIVDGRVIYKNNGSHESIVEMDPVEHFD